MAGPDGVLHGQVDIEVAIRNLLSEVLLDRQAGNGGVISGATYDTAWVARVRDPVTGQLAFPAALRSLLAGQQDDGCWEGPFPHTLIPTMAALLALRQVPSPGPEVLSAAVRAERYLRQQLPRWVIGEHDSVGFELLAPAMLAELAGLGISFVLPGQPDLARLRLEKLRLVGLRKIYAGQSGLVHSLEAFGTDLDPGQLRKLKAADGSYGCSPAATASILIYGDSYDPHSADWLARLLERGGGSVPDVSPIDIFETSWVLLALQRRTGDPWSAGQAAIVRQLLTWLAESLSPIGVSISRVAGIPVDSDDTAAALTVLNRAGIEASVEPLSAFERDDCFACFHDERGRSVSANAHVLEALLVARGQQPGWHRRAVTKCTRFLLDLRDGDGLWLDKWHLSPFYATACAALALAEHPEPAVHHQLDATVATLLAGQHPGGGWGAAEPTVEETAHVLQLLQHPRLREHFVGRNLVQAMLKGRRYLAERLPGLFGTVRDDLPRLWLGKQLYVPPRVVLATALAVLSEPVPAGA